MTSAVVAATARTLLGTWDGETVGFLAVTGTHVPSSTMQYVSEVTADEIDTGDAASYARTTATVVIDTVGDEDILTYDTGEQADFDLDGAPSVGGYWLYDTTGASDAARQLICFVPQAVAAGLADNPVLAPNGFAKVQTQPVDHETRITTLEDRTIPDPTDGDPGAFYRTDGSVGSWEVITILDGGSSS